MLNKELLLASQGVVDPKDFMKHSWFEVTLKHPTTRAGGSDIFLLSFHTPNGIALNNYTFARGGQDDLFIPVEYFNNIPFDLSEMINYEYNNFNEEMGEEVYITFKGVNSGIVDYKDVWINLNPGALYVFEGDYFYYA